MDPVLVDLARIAAQEVLHASVSVFVERHRGRKKDVPSRRTGEIVATLVDRADEGALAVQVREAHRWASIIHVQGMINPAVTADSSVPLTFAPIARRFRVSDRVDQQLNENDLVTSRASHLILGDPGSGKTTTLKRLTLSLFEESPVDGNRNDICFPIVILCREVNWKRTDLGSELLSRVGLDPVVVHAQLGTAESTVLGLTSSLLDDLRGVLIIDGIDEIPDPDARAQLLTSLSRLERQLRAARLICSSRSGEAPHLEGFAVADLLPLSSQQVMEIASLRTDETDDFMDRIAGAGIADLMDRPLFLNQLLTVYENTGGLPDRPVDLYRQLVRLLLHEWDEQRQVQRRSAYANFDSAAKLDLSAEIAFGLTECGKTTFTEADLIEVYELTADAFGLPRNHAKRVVREIESHVGLVVDIPGGFQFTHLTLQEYLCAESIVRQGMNDEVAEYLRKYPEVVAVAVALSSRPANWLADCVRRSRRFETSRHADAFANRLGLEQPRFSPTAELGESVLALLAQASDDGLANWRRLAEVQALRQSLALCASEFHFEPTGRDVRFFRRLESDSARHRRIAEGRIPMALYDMFADKGVSSSS